VTSHYQYIENVFDYRQKMGKALLVDYLNPDYFLLFSKLDLIVTKKGSELSHLSILAREHKKGIIQVNFPSNVAKTGKIQCINNKIIFYT